MLVGKVGVARLVTYGLERVVVGRLIKVAIRVLVGKVEIVGLVTLFGLERVVVLRVARPIKLLLVVLVWWLV